MKKNKNIDKELYSKIEHLIIAWNIDDTKTAGYLTRKIIKLLENENYEKNKNTSQKEYKADFLCPYEEGSIEELGYEFANSKTEEYRKEIWGELIKRVKPDNK